ncbi:cation channel sperm-associated auxiliary subunit epsilon-like [Antedon mediterranea]|uniref:cation channel sperm-associated auxiliary subunit epsilon-like n=1 Tax=Antedon mediterranea TaxID=105859 RepID=UPI003AF9EB86
MILLLVFSLLYSCIAETPALLSCLWRVTPNEYLDLVTLSTSNKFMVEYLGTADEIKWIIPQNCQVEDFSAKQTSIYCTKPGFYSITVIEIEQNQDSYNNCTKVLKVEDDPFCYQWYVSPKRNSSTNEVVTINVWIINTKNNVDTEELKGFAKEPSQGSRILSELFHLKRQEPQLQIFHEKTRGNVKVFTTLNFNQNCSCWEIPLELPIAYWTYVTIVGYSHISQDSCFIRDTKWVLIIQPEFGSVSVDGPENLVSNSSTAPKLIASICSPHLAVIMTDGDVFLTNTGFLTIQNITVNLPLDAYVVRSVAFSSNSLWLLMNDGVILNIYNIVETQVYNLGKILGIAVQQNCLNSPLYPEEDIVAAWTNESIFVRIMENLQFEQLRLPLATDLGFDYNYRMTIENSKFAFGQKQLLMLLTLKNDIKSSVFVVYNLKQKSWTYFAVSIHGIFTGNVELEIFSSSGINVIFWDTMHVYYSFDMGKSNGMMDLNLHNGSIQQVLVSRHNDIVLLSDNNQLYYTKLYSHKFIQLNPYHSQDISTSLYFDVLSRFYIITVCDGDILRQPYPLLTEVELVLYPNLYPFVRYESVFNPEVVHLDLNDEIEFKVNLIHSVQEADEIQIGVSNSHLASLAVTDEITFFPGNQGISKVVKVVANTDLTRVDNKSNAQGIMVLEAKSQKTEPFQPLGMVTKISVGCPPGRHIKVVKPRSCDHTQQFVIPESATHTETTVEYDFETYGCPIQSNHNQLFQPTVQLYDGDKYVRDVSANFMIWEENQRTEYTYNTTIKQARCCNGFTWLSMSEIVANFEYPSQMNDSCSSCDNTADLFQPYPIMNQSGLSSVKWQNKQNAMFQFTALVVDVHYSFCVLETKFAVRVEYLDSGDTSNSVMEMVLGLFTSISLTIAAISYIYFRKAHIATRNIRHLIINKDEESANNSQWSKNDTEIAYA